jgi:hypothetical protein
MHSRNQISVEMPIAMDATTAKRIAAKILYSAWVERSAYEALLPPDWLRLDPTDVVDVVFPGGSSFRTRITRIDAGADFSLSLKGVSETAATYVSTVAADGGQGLPAPFIADAAPTYLILPDIPLLRDIDDTAGAASRIYALGGGYGASGWSGAATLPQRRWRELEPSGAATRRGGLGRHHQCAGPAAALTVLHR